MCYLLLLGVSVYIEGNLIDVEKGEIYPARVIFSKTITKIQRLEKKFDTFIAPGFIEGHIRIEDALVSPLEYAKLALQSGITTVVEDPSGLIKAAGADGLKYVLSEFSKLPMDFFFLYPLNVERSTLEGGPQEISIDEFTQFVKHTQCLGLTQVTDVAKIKAQDPVLLKRTAVAKSLNKPIISNITKINFSDLGNFAHLGIRADIGSNIYQDAFEKACFGMKIKIVEGTTRKTLQGLVRLAKQFDTSIVSEDRSAADLTKGYLRATLKKAVSLGLDPITAIKNVTSNPAKLLGISEGVIAEGKKAHIVELGNLKDFEVKRVFHNGICVVKQDKLQVLKKEKPREPRYSVDLIDLLPEDVAIESNMSSEKTKVLSVGSEGVTLEEIKLPVVDGSLSGTTEVQKLVVASKYGGNQISINFIRGFCLQKGAFAVSVHGSSGNIIAIGTTDEEIVRAINLVKTAKGGFAVVDKKRDLILPLPILGALSPLDAEEFTEELKKITILAKRLGAPFDDPLLVLGNLANIARKGYKVTDFGVIDDSNAIVDILDQ
jgi:adenine deaminase